MRINRFTNVNQFSTQSKDTTNTVQEQINNPYLNYY